MQLTDRTLADLGFAEISRALVTRCSTEPGKQRASALQVLPDVEAARRSLAAIEEARGLLEEDDFSLPLGGIGDLVSAVERAAKGAALEPRELVAAAQMLFAFIRLKEALESRFERAPLLGAIAQRLPELERLAARIDRCFEPTGEIADRASAALSEARARARALHQSIKGKIERLLQDEKFLPNLREPYFSLRSGRYVLPIIAAHRAEVPGTGRASGLAWAEGTLWIGQERRIHQVDPETGAILRTIETNRFVTGVTWVDDELWHDTWEAGESEMRRVDPGTGEILETLAMPPGMRISGLESDGGDRLFCGGGPSGKVRAVRRPRRRAGPVAGN